MRTPPSLRRALLTVHIVVSVGWVGAAAAFLAVAVGATAVHDAAVIQGLYLAMEWMGVYALAPLSVLSLLSGVVQAAAGPWGLMRHWWVVMKLSLTVLATLVLLAYLSTLSVLAIEAAQPSPSVVLPSSSPVVHAGGGLLVLLVAVVLSVYKPRGLTPFGWSKRVANAQPQRDERVVGA